MADRRVNVWRWSLDGMPAIDQRVCIEQLKELWQMGLWTVPGQLAGLVVMLKVIAQSSLHWADWIGPVVLLVSTWAISGGWLRQYRRDGLDAASYKRWRQRTLLREATQSISWGWLGAVLWGGLTPEWHMLLLIGIVVFCFTSLLFCMQDFGVAVLASCPVMLIMLARLLLADQAASPYVVLILLAAFVTCLGVGHALAQRLFEGARLRHHNTALAGQLADEVHNAHEARQVAEQASRAKSDFLTAASHDLRQPLHSLTLLTGLLATAPDLGAVHHTRERMQAALDGLRFVFDQLFDVALLDAGKQPHRPQAFSLALLLEALQQEYAIAFEAKGLKWTVDGLGAWVQADPVFVQRIVRNLLDNALRYTAHGEVRLRARTRGAHIALQVWDTGQGIARGMRARVFEDYVQGHNSQRKRSEGLGLGLSVIRRLVRQGGYGLTLRSREGQGTCFSLSLPLAEPPLLPAQADAPAKAKSPSTQPALAHSQAAQPATHAIAGAGTAPRHSPTPRTTLLLIDDDADALQALRDTLEADGWPCLAAPDGPSAIEAVAGTGQWPGGIVCDYRLAPAQQGQAGQASMSDGLACIAALRHEFGLRLPAWLLTGDQGPDLATLCAQAGVRLLQKPISPAPLMAALSEGFAG